jgi:hypothetical protein|tara:strand:+ start:59 stop:196 length:138 start_codon:yes stop_codon:yes gene_type:complete
MYRLLIILLLTISLSACSGGGTNKPPIGISNSQLLGFVIGMMVSL